MAHHAMHAGLYGFISAVRVQYAFHPSRSAREADRVTDAIVFELMATRTLLPLRCRAPLAGQPNCFEALDQSGSSPIKHSGRVHFEGIEEVLGQFILEEEQIRDLRRVHVVEA